VILALLQSLTRDQSMQSIRDALRHNEENPASLQTELLWILGTMVVIVLGFVLLAGLQRTKRDRTVRNPQRLFTDLLKDMKFTFSERTLLRRIARSNKLRQPALLLLSCQFFSLNADALVRRSPWSTARASLGMRLGALCERLFGQPLVEVNPEPPPAPAEDAEEAT
jgi:hypothetical protein